TLALWPVIRHEARPWWINSSVRHQVKNDVNSQRIGPFLRKFVKEVIVLAFALPAVAVVAVVNRDDHHPALFIQNRPDMHLGAFFPTALFATVTFPSDPVISAATALPHVWCLQFVLGNAQIKYAVKDGMVHRQFHELAFGQHPLDFTMKTLPLPLPPKIISHKNPAVEKVFSQDRHFFVPQQQA